MGATLIDENMRAVFVLFTIAFIAAAFAATHEEIHSEAIELISDMKKKGATEADCKDLAKTTCREVVDEQIKDQKVIDSQSNGSECDKLGVKEVTRTVKHYHKRVKQWTASKKTITKWANHRINLGVKTFISLKAGKCGFIFTSRSYRSTYVKYHRAIKYERTVRGWVIESKKAMKYAITVRRNLQEKCHCAVVKRRDAIWRSVNSRKIKARQLKALQKCKMMQCVLAGISISDKRCRASLPRLRNKVLYKWTEHAHRSGICARRHKENHLKGERKSKARARERRAKFLRKERSAKAARKEKANKAAAKERSAKARAREQAGKHHERRSKAAERAAKERSGKIERTNKHRARAERSNKSRLRVSRHWWGGWLNNMDRQIHWQANGHTFVSGLRSFHHNGYEDRRFSPLLTNIGSTQAHKHWSGWVNNWDAYFHYDCPNNYVVTGFISYHHNHYEDRRWRFQCAHFRGLSVRRGGWPGWQTGWDATFHIGCGHRPAVGFSSYHNNHREDRRWRVQCGSFYVRM